jgi:hypothetical protein
MTRYETRDWTGRTESEKRAEQAYRHYLRLDREAEVLLNKVSRKKSPTEAEIEECEVLSARASEAYETWARLADVQHVEFDTA